MAYFLGMVMLILLGCTEKKMDNKKDTIKPELEILNGLLHDKNFAYSLAQSQKAAYYKSQGQEIPDFFNVPEKTVLKPFAEEKIAINLAGFIALECGVGYLGSAKGESPVYWIRKILEDKLSEEDWLVLNRFANATWKAGQPFRGLEKIEKENFISANFLPQSEIDKDRQQIKAAAILLLEKLESNQCPTVKSQWEAIQILIQDREFVTEMAARLDAAYYRGIGEKVPVFLDSAAQMKTMEKDPLEEKIAINIAGFYALESGLSYLAESQATPPSEILEAISKDSLSPNHKNLFLRLANATWKAGQAFRGLDKIKKDNFIPFDLLDKEEVEKDWVQIKMSAELVSPHF